MGKNSNKHRSLNRVWCTWDKKKTLEWLTICHTIIVIHRVPTIFSVHEIAVVQKTTPNLAKWNRFECNLAHIQLLYQPTITRFESPLHANNFMYLCEKCVTNFAICIPLLINNNNVSCNWFTFVRVCNWKQVKKTQTTYKIFLFYFFINRSDIAPRPKLLCIEQLSICEKSVPTFTRFDAQKQNNFNLQWKNQQFEQNKRKQHESRGNVFHTEKNEKKTEWVENQSFT